MLVWSKALPHYYKKYLVQRKKKTKGKNWWKLRKFKREQQNKIIYKKMIMKDCYKSRTWSNGSSIQWKFSIIDQMKTFLRRLSEFDESVE